MCCNLWADCPSDWQDKNARLVGKVLSMAEFYGKYPFHRVVNHAGRLVPGRKEQKNMLCEEGIFFKDIKNL